MRSGLISADALKRALVEHRKNPNEKLSRTLVRMNLTSYSEVAEVLSRQSNIPFIDLNMVVIDPRAVQKIPAELAMKHHILPIYAEKNNLVLAVEDPYDFEAVEAARFASGLNIRPHVASYPDISNAIQRYHALDVVMKARAVQKPDEDMDFILKHTLGNDVQLAQLKEQSKSAVVQNTLNTIIFQAIAIRADAIVFEPLKTHLQVRNRANGALSNGTKIPKKLQKAMLAHIKIMAGLDYAKHMIPQKGRTQYHMQQRTLELEVSCLPAQYGESVIIQILDFGEQVPLIKDLGFQAEDMMKALKLLSLPNGMILVCGPPGSGQTATVYALAHEVLRHQRRIVTIEASIGYQLKGAQQVQINAASGLNFSRALESVLRQHTEVIVLGDIRDKKTAETALRASLNGHLILGVVRSRTLTDAISDLIALGVSPQLVSSALSGIITQRMVRKLCPHCREQYHPLPSLLKKIEETVHERPSGEFLRGKGCQACNFSGFHERFAVYYIALMSQTMARIIQQDVTKSGISRIESSLLSKAILARVTDGETSLEELERVIFHDGRPRRLLNPEDDEQVEQFQQSPQAEAPQHSAPVKASAPLPDEPVLAQTQGSLPVIVRYKAEECKILIVEPNLKLKTQISNALIARSFQVLSATNGVEALETIVRELPDLVICESVLPKLDGLNMVYRLRKSTNTGGIPVIIISSKAETADRIRGFAAGSDDYLPKPFSMHELFLRINAILRRTRRS